MIIKVKLDKGAFFPKELEVGDWYDLTTKEDVTIEGPEAKMLHRDRKTGKIEGTGKRDVSIYSQLIDFGVAMKLPKGYEAHVLPRSSLFKNYGIILGNSMGMIDNSYQGNNDTWKFMAIALRKTFIPEGTRIAQFRIIPNQKATIWQKLRWLFSGKPKFVLVDSLESENRGGIGSTGNM